MVAESADPLEVQRRRARPGWSSIASTHVGARLPRPAHRRGLPRRPPARSPTLAALAGVSTRGRRGAGRRGRRGRPAAGPAGLAARSAIPQVRHVLFNGRGVGRASSCTCGWRTASRPRRRRRRARHRPPPGPRRRPGRAAEAGPVERARRSRRRWPWARGPTPWIAAEQALLALAAEAPPGRSGSTSTSSSPRPPATTSTCPAATRHGNAAAELSREHGADDAMGTGCAVPRPVSRRELDRRNDGRRTRRPSSRTT